MRLSAKAILSGALALIASNLLAAPKDGGGIVFIGDSITQGGTYLAGTVPSYRYQLFKNFVDNGIAFTPMGMTDGARHGVNVVKLTPDYRGKSFTNVSEAAASGRAYQYAGHPATSGGVWGKNKFKSDPGAVANVANRGPVTRIRIRRTKKRISTMPSALNIQATPTVPATERNCRKRSAF